MLGIRKLYLLLPIVLFLTGCLEVDDVWVVNPDGSGRVTRTGYGGHFAGRAGSRAPGFWRRQRGPRGPGRWNHAGQAQGGGLSPGAPFGV